MDINKIKLEKIKEYKLLLDEYYILYCKYYGFNWLEVYKPLTIMYIRLLKKGLLNESYDITTKGLEVCRAIINDEVYEEDFEEFWKEFPSSDKWGNYMPSRTMRNNKTKAKILYFNLRKRYSAKEILDGLTNEIAIRKANSKKENNMKYMQNVCTWLNNETFRAFSNDTLKAEQEKNLYGKDLV